MRLPLALLGLLGLLTLLCPAAALAEEPSSAPRPVASLSALLGTGTSDALAARAVLDPQRAIGDGVSLGTTSSGQLARGVALPVDGEHLVVLATHRERAAHYASENLAQLLADVSAGLRADEEDAPRLVLGDASDADGGDLRGHGSHNAGRDVDVVFFARDASDRPVEPTRFLTFRDADTLTTRDGKYRFDLERNWAFVEALLAHDTVEVQYIFVYDPLRQKLLEHASARGVDAALVARAAQILRQPGDSAPHDDHFHVRVFCSARDRLEGCDNRGPAWPWAELHDDRALERAGVLVRAVAVEPSLAGVALGRVATLRARDASLALAGLLGAAQVEVRDAALGALWQTGVSAAAYPALAAAASREPEAETRRALYGLIGASAHLDAVAFLASAATHEGDAESALRAARALATLEHRATAPALIALLEHDEAAVRTVALDALRALTNQGGPEAVAEASALAGWWQSWWREHGAETREAWLVAGFRDAGIELASVDAAVGVLPQLIAAQTEQPEHVALNAHRLMMRATDHWFSASTPAAERRERWEKWWGRNRWRLEADAKP